MRLAFYVIEDRGSCSCKARHRLKEGIREVRYVSSEPVGEAPEESKGHPARRDGNVAVTSGELSFAALADNEAPQSDECGGQCSGEESKQVISLQERRCYAKENKDARKQ